MLLSSVVVADSESLAAKLESARALLLSENHSALLELCQQLILQWPEHSEVTILLARALGSHNRLSEAEALLRRQLEKLPSDVELIGQLASVLHKMQNLAAARDEYARAVELAPNRADLQFNLGIVLEALGALADATERYRKASQLEPTNPRYLTRVAAMLIHGGYPSQALQLLDAALQLRSTYVDALYYRGWALSLLERGDEALVSYQRALRIQPDRYEFKLARVNLMRDTQRWDEAFDAYLDLLNDRPLDLNLHEELNKILWQLDRQDLFLRSLSMARAKVGDDPRLLLMEAAFRMRAKQPELAEPLLRAALQRELRADCMAMLARCLAALKRFNEAYPLFLSAIRIEPLVLLHRHELAFSLLSAGDPRAALRVLDEARKIDPLSQTTLATYSLAFRQLNDSRLDLLVDYDRYVKVVDTEPPKDFRSEREFNDMLAKELDRLHVYQRAPIDQTLRGGTQTSGQLLEQGTPVIRQCRRMLSNLVASYMNETMQADLEASAHSDMIRFAGSWSCRLGSGGQHLGHIHPQGVISAVYYVGLPSHDGDPQSRSGWLTFGQSHLELGSLDSPVRYIEPRPGRLVMFPSFYWHGTLASAGEGDRLTIAFDVAR